MKTYSGIMVNSGFALGKVYFLDEPDFSVIREECIDSETEITRLEETASSIILTLSDLREKTSKMHGSDSADTFFAHIMFLSDRAKESLIGRSIEYIKKDRVNAEYAVSKAAEDLAADFEKSSSDYLRARSEDIGHLGKMMIAGLMGNCGDCFKTGVSADVSEGTPPFILVSAELSPEALASIDPQLLLGIVTAKGSPLSHTAILAGNMNVPYLTGVELTGISSGAMAAIDGAKEVFILEPDDENVKRINEEIRTGEGKRLSDMKNSVELIENSPIRLYANIGKPEDVHAAIDNHAGGIGLFRSEFLYMDGETPPTEEEQYKAYVQVLDAMGGKPVTVRTIDLGADKEAKCVPMPKEANPALGTRGIRISFANPELFETQLRALLRAAYGRNLRIMFPMISSEWEVKKAIETVNDVASALESEGICYSIPDLGIMVETPAAVLILDKLAPYVKFVSIGTNDLTQYTLALDRVNFSLAEYFIPRHEAVLKLIDMTVQTAHKYDVEVGICGELGSDTTLMSSFVKMGVDELSMAANKILAAAFALNSSKERIQSMDILSPVEGYVVPMEEIPDETFATGLLGACVGIMPEENIIYAPCDGEISMVAKTGHAFSIRRESGDEILIHIGIDTVELDGRGFDNNLKVGQKVTSGEKLVRFDINLINEAGFSPIVVIVKLK